MGGDGWSFVNKFDVVSEAKDMEPEIIEGLFEPLNKCIQSLEKILADIPESEQGKPSEEGKPKCFYQIMKLKKEDAVEKIKDVDKLYTALNGTPEKLALLHKKKNLRQEVLALYGEKQKDHKS